MRAIDLSETDIERFWTKVLSLPRLKPWDSDSLSPDGCRD